MPIHYISLDAGTKARVVVSTIRRVGSEPRYHAHIDFGEVRIEGAEGCDASELARILRQAADMITSEVDLLRGAPASNVTRLMRDLDDAVRERNEGDRARLVANRTLTSLRAEAVDGKNNNPRDAA